MTADDTLEVVLEGELDIATVDDAQRRVAAAAARWVLAFNARCDLAMLSGEPDPTSALGRLLEHRAAYG